MVHITTCWFFFHLPEGFDLAKDAPLFCAGITSFYPIKKYLKKGMKKAVYSIGGLGHVVPPIFK